METNTLYELYGYIEYTQSPVGFVTPVFRNGEGEYYIQSSLLVREEVEWDLLPVEYCSSVIPYKEGTDKGLSDVVIYGFKWNSRLFFAPAGELANYLTKFFLPSTEEGIELVKCFLEDWQQSKSNLKILNKEDIWEKCLALIRRDSRILPHVFRKNFEVIDFDGGILMLRSDNVSVRDVFENSFKRQLISKVREEISDFNINVAWEDNPYLPVIIFECKQADHSRKLLIRETGINPFQGFDNFIVMNFNGNAYKQARNFMENSSSTVITILGTEGAGKTHLLNSIARHLTAGHSRNKVGLYTTCSSWHHSSETVRSAVSELESLTSFHDIIIIDDVHKIRKETRTVQQLGVLIEKWKDMKKKVVLSYSVQEAGLVPTYVADSEQVMLTLPNGADKRKIIEVKSSTHHIDIAGRDILMLSEDEEVKTVADIQKALARIFLTEELRRIIKSSTAYSSIYRFDPTRMESYIYDYFEVNPENALLRTPEVASLNARIISDFIQDIFFDRRRFFRYVSGSFCDATPYSFSTLQHYLFESRPFRRVILEIMQELMTKGTEEH